MALVCSETQEVTSSYPFGILNWVYAEGLSELKYLSFYRAMQAQSAVMRQ